MPGFFKAWTSHLSPPPLELNPCQLKGQREQVCVTLNFTFTQGARPAAALKTTALFVHLTALVGSQTVSWPVGRLRCDQEEHESIVVLANSSTSRLGILREAPPGTAASWGHCSALGIHSFTHSFIDSLIRWFIHSFVSKSVSQHHSLSQEEPATKLLHGRFNVNKKWSCVLRDYNFVGELQTQLNITQEM